MSKMRLYLADDHPLILEGMKSLLMNDFEICGTARNGRDLVSGASELKPDCVLLDISMPLLNGIEAAQQIRKSSPQTKFVFVTQSSDREYIRAAFQGGASGYVIKQSVATEINCALESVLSGRIYISPDLEIDPSELNLESRSSAIKSFGKPLTHRQREVLQLVSEGKSNKDVAHILGVSVKTVDFHKAAIMRELGLRSTAQLTQYAIAHGICTAYS